MVESDFAESMLTTSSFHVLNVSAKNVKIQNTVRMLVSMRLKNNIFNEVAVVEL